MNLGITNGKSDKRYKTTDELMQIYDVYFVARAIKIGACFYVKFLTILQAKVCHCRLLSVCRTPENSCTKVILIFFDNLLYLRQWQVQQVATDKSPWKTNAQYFRQPHDTQNISLIIKFSFQVGFSRQRL